MVKAPFDWNDPGNRETIELAAVHIPATGDGEPIGTLLSNPGGPGVSGLDLAYGLAVAEQFRSIREQYDMLGFDPRGIGRSTPIECDAESSIHELNLAMCAKEQPLALSMGTSQVARDMDLLRSLMGDDSMHYLGYSYGSMLGAAYATLFPERVGRMILDGAEATDWASPIGHFDQTVAIAREASALLEGCGTLYRATSCPVNSESALAAAISRYNDEPMIAGDGTEVDGNMLYEYITSALYQRATVREHTLDTLGAAVAGGQDQIDEIAEEMAGGGTAVGLAGSIVSCHSFPDDPDLPGLVAHIQETGLSELLGGPEIDDETLRPFVELYCAALPNSGDDITDSFSGSPDAPILVIGVTRDHATPYQGAQELVRQLGNARLLTVEGTGHTVAFSDRSSCADDFATAYLLKGDLPPENSVCTDD